MAPIVRDGRHMKGSGIEVSLVALFETMSQGVVIYGASAAIVSANPAAQRILGLAEDEILGPPSTEPRWRAVREDGSPYPRDHQPAMRALRAGGPAGPETLGLEDPASGERRWIRVEAAPLPDGGAYAIFTDVTPERAQEQARRDAETRLRLLAEQVPAVVWTTDRELRVTSVLGGGLRALEVAPESLVGRMVAGLAGERGLRTTTAAHVRALEGESGLVLEEGMRGRSYVIHVDPLTSEAGEVVGTVGVALDSTELQEADRSLRELRRQQDSLLNTIPDLAWLKDASGRYLAVNEAFAEAVGRPIDDILGRRSAEIWPEPLASTFADADRRVMERREPDTMEEPAELPGVGRRVLETKRTPLRNSEGVVMGTTGVARDVTDRRRAERVAADQRAFLQAVIDAVPSLIFTKNARGEYTMVGAAMAEAFGRSVEAILGSTDDDLFDDPAVLARLRRDDHHVLETGQTLALPPREIEVGASGECRWYRTVKVPFQVPGDDVQVLGIATDVTEQKRAADQLEGQERWFRSLMENVEDIISVTDAHGRITYVSASIESTLGYRPDDVVGRSFLDWVHPDDRSRIEASVRRDSEQPGGGRTLTYRFRAASGEWRVIESSSRNLLEDEHVQGIVVASRDVTERRLLEDQLRHSQKLEAVGLLAAGIAHDFNNLLTAMRGHAQLILEDRVPDPEVEAGVREMDDAAERAAALTRQLLAFSRKQLLQPEVFDLARAIGAMDTMLRRLIPEDIALVVSVPHDRQVPVRADRTQVEQVVVNLAVNARDAMPGGGRLVLELDAVALEEPRTMDDGGRMGPGPYAVLAVRDTGTGMSEETRRRIFEPFFTTKELGKGTGLGLSTVYGIVKQSDGAIEVDSSPAAGTTFRIYLPLREEVEEPVAETVAGTIGGDERILLVEDDASVRRLCSRSLRRGGHEVIEATSGRHALELAAGTPDIDLVITDVVMPELSGADFIERLRAIHGSLPVLFMSGYTEDEVLRHGIESGREHFIEKPFTPRQLGERVRRILDART